MNRIFPGIIFSIIPFLAYCQNNMSDMTVFGFKIGETFSIPECKCQTMVSYVNVQAYPQFKTLKKYKYFIYAKEEAPTGGCFFRNVDWLLKYAVGKEEELKPMPAVADGTVTVIFPPADIPKIFYDSTFTAVVRNYKLTTISFYISSDNASEVLETLKKKYGNNAAIKSYQLQNGLGGTRNYYSAVWSLPGLRITMWSNTHRYLADRMGSVTIEIPPVEKQGGKSL